MVNIKNIFTNNWR